MKRYEAFKTQFCDSEQGGDASNPRVAGFKFGPVGGKPQGAPVSEAGKSPASAGQKTGQPATKKFKDDDDFF